MKESPGAFVEVNPKTAFLDLLKQDLQTVESAFGYQESLECPHYLISEVASTNDYLLWFSFLTE